MKKYKLLYIVTVFLIGVFLSLIHISMRLKTAQLGYTLPAALTKKVAIQQVRLYVSAENLFTFTGYDGFDPEVATGDYTRIGVDRGVYPQSRTIYLGANISF